MEIESGNISQDKKYLRINITEKPRQMNKEQLELLDYWLKRRKEELD
jgi:hypothetical protein